MIEQKSPAYDLAPNYDRWGGFTCGSCGKRRPDRLFHAHRGRGGGKWIECKKCASLKRKRKAALKAAK